MREWRWCCGAGAACSTPLLGTDTGRVWRTPRATPSRLPLLCLKFTSLTVSSSMEVWRLPLRCWVLTTESLWRVLLLARLKRCCQDPTLAIKSSQIVVNS